MEYTLVIILFFFLAGPCLSLPAQVTIYESVHVLFLLIKSTYFAFILQISSHSNFGARRQRRSYAGKLYYINYHYSLKMNTFEVTLHFISFPDDIEENTQTAMDKIIDVNDYQGKAFANI